MTWLGVIIFGVSFLGLIQIAVVVIGWRLAGMRGRAVAEWQDCDVQGRRDGEAFCTDDWQWADDAVLLTHETIRADDGDVLEDAPPEWWSDREHEVRHLRFLADQLEERAK